MIGSENACEILPSWLIAVFYHLTVPSPLLHYKTKRLILPLDSIVWTR